MWILLACLSAVFAGITSILAKIGIRKTDSDVATALRCGVVLIFAWLMVFLVGSQTTIGSIEPRSLLMIALSGLATGASWLCYFKALAVGEINKVVPIDKSSTILSILFAIAILGETEHLFVKLLGVVLIGAGTFLMIQKKEPSPDHSSKSDDPSDLGRGKGWLFYALLSAVFAALTSILAKIGIHNVESNLATALRTIVVLVMAWVIVLIKGKAGMVKKLDKREMLFIALSGLATGASWLCYYSAIKNGVVSVVVPIDKMSILVTIALSAVLFKEKLTAKGALGLVLITAGTLAMAIFA